MKYLKHSRKTYLTDLAVQIWETLEKPAETPSKTEALIALRKYIRIIR